jgi:site-specific DNA-cytosine methylase
LESRLKDYLDKGFEESVEEFPQNIERKSSKTPKIIYYEIPKMVRVRVYEVEVQKLVTELRKCKKEKKLTNKAISTKLGQPLTLVEHWFRADKYNAIPSDEIWYDLKGLLGVEATEFDKSIMTYEIREGKYDHTNRVYDIEGIAPTITTMGDSIRITDGKGIRNLTVREVWRLMGFIDNDIDKVINEVSEKQLFKQAGNSIVVGVLEEIFKEIVSIEKGV